MTQIGDVEGYPEGSTFANRAELSAAGVHTPTQAGIAGSQESGAVSVVLNEGYEDDVDDGDAVVYTGHGGRDSSSGKQVADQELVRGNRALVVSELKGQPVRVIRGPRLSSNFAPGGEYRYDGLYRVESHWQQTGRAGFRIWRFRLGKDSGAMPPTLGTAPSGQPKPKKTTGTVSRVVRDTAVSRYVKELYDYSCQVCGTCLSCQGGPYAEGAHIIPLGSPHEGPDTVNNVLCLCPNHHVLFDKGGFGIADDLSLIGVQGSLNVCSEHAVSIDSVRYHRSLYFDGELAT